MRLTFVLLLFTAFVVAQDPAQGTAKGKGKGAAKAKPSDPDEALHLRGDRFPPIKYADMTPAQKKMADRAIAGSGPIGDWGIMLRSPELSDSMRLAGLRGQSALSAKQNEMAIIVNARYWTSQFEWWVHKRAALQAGITQETVDAIAEGRVPPHMPPDEKVVYDFLREILTRKQVSDPTFAAAKEQLGEKGIVDLFNIAGFYMAASGFMNADRYPFVDPNQKPDLKTLEHPLP
jgi:4-carboxymuconolactone decarboxylase